MEIRQMMTFEEVWENIKRDYPELTASSYTGISLSKTEEMARKIWETATYTAEHKDVVNTEKTICVNCSHYEKQGEDDACCLEEPDYVHGGMRQVCDFCRDINTNGNCKYYEQK